MHILAAALLLAATVGPELGYGPYTRPSPGDGPSLAVGARGLLLAWSEVENRQPQIRIARLDRNGSLASPILTLPGGGVAPTVATDGTSFFLAYLKDNEAWGLPIDATGQPIGVPRRFGPSAAFKPTLVWDGTSYLLWTSIEVFAIAPDGSIRYRTHTEPPEAVSANGEIAFAWWTRIETPIWGTCYFPGLGCTRIGTRISYDISWAAGAATGAHDAGEGRFSPPAVASSDGDVVIAWTRSNEVLYFVVDHEIAGVAADADITVPPGLACKGGECLIAYGTKSGDVHTLLFTIEDFTLTQLLPIATSERLETAPRVLAIGPGRFLVTYLSDSSDKRFAGRIVTLGPSKRRSVR